MTREPEREACFAVDCHSHILPGMDDGAADSGEALEIARILAGRGFAAVCCTPHLVNGWHEPDGRRVTAAVEELQDRIGRAGIDLRLHGGREYCLDEYLAGFMDDPLPLAGSDRVLVEAPAYCTTEMFMDILFSVRCKGLVPVVAHPERCPLLNFPGLPKDETFPFLKLLPFRLRPLSPRENSPGGGAGLVSYLKDIGCLFQANIGSFAGMYGNAVRRHALRFLEQGLYSCLGSDAHQARRLDERLGRGLREIERIVGREGLGELLKGRPAVPGGVMLPAAEGGVHVPAQ